MAAPSSYVKNNTHGSITLRDGTSITPVLLLTEPFDRGDLQIGGLGPRLNDLVLVQARGRHISPAYGNRRYPTFSFSFWVSNLIGSTASQGGTIIEFITGKGAYAGNTNTAGTNRPWMLDLILTMEGTAFGDASDETVTLNDCHCTFDFQESVDGNQVSISGTIAGAVDIVNGSNTVQLAQISAPTP